MKPSSSDVEIKLEAERQRQESLVAQELFRLLEAQQCRRREREERIKNLLVGE